MGNRSKNSGCWHVRVRADNDHYHKKRTRAQKQHLKKLKSKRELREILLAGRHRGKI